MKKHNKRVAVSDIAASPVFWFACGAVAGSAITFFCDTAQGARRRGLVRDKFTSLSSGTSRRASRVSRNLSNRARGMISTYAHLPRWNSSVDDDILNRRIRSRLGHLVDHAHSIETSVRDGVVTVSGPVFSTIAKDVVKLVRSLEGVKDVIDELDVQQSTEPRQVRRGDANPLLQ